jgi:glutaredoxin 3
LIYSSRFCPFCFRAKALLQKKGVEFEEILVDSDPTLRQKMMKESGRHTVPQIWLGSLHVGGCDDLFALEAKGELDAILDAL